MRSAFKKCIKCEEYTLQDICPRCGTKTRNPVPPRFSLQDPYGRYRRKIKEKSKKHGRIMA